jgi:hypothetical protein
MIDPANQPDSELDPRLGAWLREAVDGQPAADCQPAAGADHLAHVRRTLLERLEPARPVPASPIQPAAPGDEPVPGLPGLWVRHRLAFGSVAASIALAGALVIALNSGVRLSAMERMAKELKEVTSYSYRSSGSNSNIDDDGRRETRKDDTTVSWMSGDGFRTETKIVKIVEDLGGGNPTEETLVHLEEVFPPGKPGLFIEHQHKTFVRIHYDPIGSNMYPHDYIRMIREGSYDVLGDLGTRQIGETKAHGFRLMLKNPHDEENLVRDPVELWVDPETDLPVEISWTGGREGWVYTDLTNEFHWNTPLDPKQFEPAIPAGYADITPPSDQEDLDQIVAALRLFAELAGGHYPQEKKFNPRRLHDGMLRMADFSLAADPKARDEKRQEIEQAMAGLKWIARILRNRYSSGYRGALVGPTDKDQVLLWFSDPASNGYRVFYGDLRTKVVNEEEKSKLIPKHEIVGEPQSE